MPRAYVPRYSATVTGKAPVESRVTFSYTGAPSGVENCPFQRWRLAATFPPWRLPKKYTTTSAATEPSRPEIVYWASRIDELDGAMVQPTGMVAWYSSNDTAPWAVAKAGIVQVSTTTRAAKRSLFGVITKM